MLAIESISKRLGSFEIVDVSLAITSGEYFVLLGESGAGKTVLLEIVSGLITPDAGRIKMNGVDLTHVPIQKRNMGLVYQDHALFPHMSVAKNVAYPLKSRGFRGDVDEEVERLAELTGATELLDREPDTLSLGEKQRVALARALAMKPDVLLLDEPLASLDVQSKTAIRSLLRRLNQRGQTIVHVTHDYHEAIALADRIAVLENSAVAQVGTPDQIFQRPQSKFVANFAGIKNYFKGDYVKSERDVGLFKTDMIEFDVASDADDGYACVILRSENVTVSMECHDTSARNHFRGKVVDIEPAHLGIEIYVDVGEVIAALITRQSLEKMTIEIGTEVWVNFKASAVTLLKE